jgi:autotransporter-associated beta strand protein
MARRNARKSLAVEKLESRYVLNAAPVLDPTASPELLPVLDNSGAPFGEVGTLVSNLIDSGGTLDNFSDADGDAPGIAITGVNLQGGTLWYSVNGGASWTDMGAVSDQTPKLLAANFSNRIYYEPPENFTGTVHDLMSFKAWDGDGVRTQVSSGLPAGAYVTLSASGTMLAKATPLSIDIYELNGETWTKKGLSIARNGPGADTTNRSVSLSHDGNTVSFGTVSNNVSCTQVYRWTDGAWQQLGGDLSIFGQYTATSADGNTVAVGSPDIQGLNLKLSAYRWDINSWKQLGQSQVPSSHGTNETRLGVSISADGQTIATTSSRQDLGTPSGVAVFRWNLSWLKLDTPTFSNIVGWTPVMSGDGKTIALTTSQRTVQALHWDGNAWITQGPPIAAELTGTSLFGQSLALSEDGKTLLIGEPWYDGAGTWRGRVHRYTWNGDQWLQQGSPLIGTTDNQQLGRSVSLSADGLTEAAAVGKVYRWLPTTSSYSEAADSVSIEVTPRNIAPILDEAASPKLTAVPQNAPSPVGPVGTLVSALIDNGGGINNFTDAEQALPGIAITDVSLKGGSLWFSANNGTTWNKLGAVSETLPKLLSADSATRLYYEPAPDYWGDIGDLITFKAWDKFGNYRQIGQTINGVKAGDRLGYSVSASSDGASFLYGEPYNDAKGTNFGRSRVRSWNGQSWVVSKTFTGEAVGDLMGYSVALSSDGETMVAGSPLNDRGGTSSGLARVYRKVSGAWQQIGSDIQGVAAGDQFGSSIAVSADGQTVAIGALRNDAGGSDSGHVRVFQFDGVDWRQVGLDIVGGSGSYSGRSVSLSADGGIVAIGGNSSARVFLWNGKDWVQLGGNLIAGWSGSVSLSADGYVLAVGNDRSDLNGADSGSACVYKWNGVSWVLQGAEIVGDRPGDQFGYSVTLSASGELLAVGARYGNSVWWADCGYVETYRWNGTEWQLVQSLVGAHSDDQFGFSISLSDDSLAFVVGTPYSDQNGLDSGVANVYRYTLERSSLSAESDFVGIAVTPPDNYVINFVGVGEIRVDDTAYSGDTTVVKTGGGTLILNKANTHTGGLQVNEGAVILQHVDALNGGPLVVKPGAKVVVDTGTSMIALSSLSLDPAGQLDVGAGGITVAAGGFVEVDIRQLLISGCNNGAWDGATGIVHGSTEPGRAIGYKVDANGILTIRQTMAGDVDMNGKVDFDDILGLFPNYGTTSGMVWSGGDITYDDKVDFDDIVALFPNYGGGSAFSNGVGAGGGGTGTLAGFGGGGGTSTSTAPSRDETTAAPVMAPEPPAELGQQTTVTLTRDSGSTTSDVDATSLAFAALAEQGGINKKTDDGGIDPGLSLGL